MVLSSIWAKWRMKRRAFFKHVSEIFSIYRLESELPENVCNFFNIGFFFFFPGKQVPLGQVTGRKEAGFFFTGGRVYTLYLYILHTCTTRDHVTFDGDF